MSTVLVVEDDPDLRDAVQELLEGEGFSTIGACNGADAIGILEGLPIQPSLVLLDLNMPVMDGWELLRTLDGDQRWADVPRIAMTALDNDPHIGDTPWVHKPFVWDHLITAIRKACPQNEGAPMNPPIAC